MSNDKNAPATSQADQLTRIAASAKRPTRVTVISWIILVAASCVLVIFGRLLVLAAVGEFTVTVSGMQFGIVVALGIASGVIGVVSAVAMLKGLNWGRLLYLIAIPILNILKWLGYGYSPAAPSGISVMLNVIGYFVFLYYLTTPVASAFFRCGQMENNKFSKRSKHPQKNAETIICQCPECGSMEYKKRFFGGSRTLAPWILLVGVWNVLMYIGGLWTDPMNLWGGLLIILVAIMAYTSKKYRCAKCKKLFNWYPPEISYPPEINYPPEISKLKVVCPKCGAKLKGATSDMIGDTAVCSKCKAEFEIRDERK